jgi:hypothetical protein
MDVLEDEFHQKNVVVKIWVDDEKSKIFFKLRNMQT